MKTPKVKNRTFNFTSEAEFRRSRVSLTRWEFDQLRVKLPKSIYWIQPTERGKIHWNEILLIDFLTSGDRPDHQALVEEYLMTLPKVV